MRQREPVRWLLVEKRYGDLEASVTADDGKTNPDAMVLSFQPLYAEDLAWEVAVEAEGLYVEVLGYSPRGVASPGETVTATVRVGKAKAWVLYRLSVSATRTDVRILGETQAIVRGSQPAVFRFTSGGSGRAGIAVAVAQASQ